MLMRSSKAWLHSWQPKKKTVELTPYELDMILRELIQRVPTLDSLYMVRDCLSDYLAVYDEMKEDTDG
jgi:hypothetical protein